MNGKGERRQRTPPARRRLARQVSAELGSARLDTLGRHARQFQKCTGVLYELKVSHAAAFDPPEEYAAAIFGVYNEALSNVARHAGASRIGIALTITPHEVTIGLVRDQDEIGGGLPVAEEVAPATAGRFA